jgi:hypothetical protein
MSLDNKYNSKTYNIHFYYWINEFSGELYLERIIALSFNQ